MMIPTRYVILVVLCLASFGLGWYMHSPAPPSYQPIIDAQIAVAKAETVFVQDTIYATRWKVRYDSIRDTLNITDTVQVREYVRVADSSLFACHKALASCTNALKLKDTVIVKQHTFLEKQQPRSKVIDILLVGVGVYAGYRLRNR